MASISNRNGRFLVRVRKDGYKLAAKTFTRKQDAVAWGRMVETAMETGKWQEDQPCAPTLAEAIDLYRGTVGKRLKGSTTYAYWWDELSQATIAAKNVAQLTPLDVSIWRDSQMQRGLKPGTVVRKLGMLSGLLTWCQKERGWITQNPVKGIVKPRANDSRSRVLSAEEYEDLMEAAKKSRAKWLADCIVVMAFSGMRRGELWRLTPNDIDFSASIARLRETKNGFSREVPLCPTAAAALTRLCSAAQEAHAGSTAMRLIPVRDCMAISLAFRRTLDRARRQYAVDCRRAGNVPQARHLSDVRLHDLRHTAVTRWARTGALTLIELAAVSGHRSLASLKRYAHLATDQVAAKLAQASSAPRTESILAADSC